MSESNHAKQDAKPLFQLLGWSGSRHDHGTYNGSYTWFNVLIQHRSETKWQCFERCIQRNVHASSDFRVHVHTWNHDDADTDIAQCVHNIRSGDVIQVLAKAQFPGWVNHVKSVEVEIHGESGGVVCLGLTDS